MGRLNPATKSAVEHSFRTFFAPYLDSESKTYEMRAKILADFCETFDKRKEYAVKYLKQFENEILESNRLTSKMIDAKVLNTKLKGVNIGLKAKIERQLDLQRMLEPDYLHKEVFIIDSEAKTIERPLKPSEIIMIHKELSLMSGDYAPTKVDVKHDINPVLVVKPISTGIKISKDDDIQDAEVVEETN